MSKAASSASPVRNQTEPGFSFLRLKGLGRRKQLAKPDELLYPNQMREHLALWLPTVCPKREKGGCWKAKHDTFSWVAFRCCVIQLLPPPPHPSLPEYTPPHLWVHSPAHLSVSRKWPNSFLSLPSLSFDPAAHSLLSSC